MKLWAYCFLSVHLPLWKKIEIASKLHYILHLTVDSIFIIIFRVSIIQKLQGSTNWMLIEASFPTSCVLEKFLHHCMWQKKCCFIHYQVTADILNSLGLQNSAKPITPCRHTLLNIAAVRLCVCVCVCWPRMSCDLCLPMAAWDNEARAVHWGLSGICL